VTGENHPPPPEKETMANIAMIIFYVIMALILFGETLF